MIDVANLSKSFAQKTRLFQRSKDGERTVRAVNEMSFRIHRGEFVGFLGPNGAGKSTTIKMLTGILHPTTGTVTVAGLSPVTERVALAKEIGVVFGQRTQLWWDLPLYQSFEILRAMYRIPKEIYRDRLSELTQLLDLDAFHHRPVRQLSLGQRMRGELAGALLHGPKVLFLDEPTIGLDVTAKNAVRQFLKRLNEDKGVTIILTTHDMSDVEELCDRILVINHGEKVFDGPREELERTVGIPSAMTALYREKPALPEVDDAIFERLRIAKQTDARKITVQFDRRNYSAASVLADLQSWGELVDFSLDEPSLESVIEVMYQVERKTQFVDSQNHWSAGTV